MTVTVNELILTRKILVCCGAGGVGKTTTATGLALAAARAGRRVLALTVDPSRRLAETLGVERNLKAPVSMPEDRLTMARITPPATLHTWMLDPQLVADRVVRRFAKNPETARRLMDNRIYQQITRMVAGMQEYTAMEALYAFIKEGEYDLIVLDTPPSRNALDFLEGPSRLQRFFDSRIFQLFKPGEEEGFFRRAAANVIERAMTASFGEDNYLELQEFFDIFGDLFSLLTGNAAEMRTVLENPEEVSFLLVTSTTPESITDAMFFRRKTREMKLPFAGFVLNRSQAHQFRRVFPDMDLFPPDLTDSQRGTIDKFQALARLEQAQMERDQSLLDDLGSRAEDGFAIALPNLPGGANEMRSLLLIADALMAS